MSQLNEVVMFDKPLSQHIKARSGPGGIFVLLLAWTLIQPLGELPKIW